MATTTPTSQFGARDRDYFDPSLTQSGIGVVIAIVGYNQTRLKRENVVAILPLLALSLKGIPTRWYLAYVFETQDRRYDIDEGLLLARCLNLSLSLTRSNAEGLNALDDGSKDCHQVAIAEREDRVQVHVRAVPW